MTRRTPTINPELRAHQEWLGYLQPVGLVVAPAAMVDAGWVVTRSGSELIERQERYREAIQGLTSTYNRFHDPAETSSEHLELRRLNGEMDQAVLAAYGWSDVPTACGFGLDYPPLPGKMTPLSIAHPGA